MTEKFAVIVLRGDPYTRGVELGRQTKEMIEKNVNYYLHLWKKYASVTRDWVLSESGKFAPVIRKYDSDILEEMKGVAEGAKLTLEEVIALNTRWEFFYATMMKSEIAPTAECTALSATSDVTADGHTILAQNWDYLVPVRDNCVILVEVQEPKKPNVVMHVEAGTLGHKGMNSAGLGLVVNGMLSDRDKYEPKLPFLVMLRGTLNQRTLQRALLAISRPERSVSGNIMLAQAGGECIDIEAAPGDYGVLYDEDGVLSHANNFCDPRVASKLVDKIKISTPDSLIRVERSAKLLRKYNRSVDVDAFSRTLSDHFGNPDSICRHQNEMDTEVRRVETLASVIMDLDDRVMWISRGPPCSNPYVRLEFPDLQPNAK